MSTKIYGAYKLSKPIEWIFDFLHELRPQIQDIIREDLYKKSAKQAYQIIDNPNFGLSYTLDTDLYPKFKDEINKERTLIQYIMFTLIGYGKLSYSSDKRLTDGYDYNASCVVIKSGKRQNIIKFFSDNTNVNKFIAQKIFENGGAEYCYYDNSDRPDDVSASEWNKRKKFWSSMNFLTYKEMGFTFELGLSEMEFFYPDDEKYNRLKTKIMENLSTMREARIKNKGKSLFIRRYKELFASKYTKEDQEDMEFFSNTLFFDSLDYMETEEGKNEYENFVKTQIEPKIFPITIDQLEEVYTLTEKYEIKKQ